MSNTDNLKSSQQKLKTSPSFLSRENREGGNPVRHHSLALVCHIYYPKLIEELVAQCAPLENNFDLYVSISKEKLDLIPIIFKYYPDAYIYLTENVGRDINPFIVILKAIQHLGYDTLLKLHTKQSPHRSDGKYWRQDMVGKLLGTKENIASIREKFAQDPQVGLIAPRGHVISYRAYCGASRDRVLRLAQATGLNYSDEHDFPFAAGTMFWANPKALERLTRISEDELKYEDEPLTEDGALVHAIERFIGLAVVSDGFTILDVDGKGNLGKPDLKQDYPYTPSSKQLKLRNIRSIILFSPYDERFAIEHVRITAPYTQAGIQIVNGVVNGEIRFDLISLVDAVVFQREFPRNLTAYRQIRQTAEEHAIPIIYDLDDLLFDLPGDHPERQSMDYADALMPMMTALVNADLVTVATAKLKETLADFNENIQVVPNYLDDALWELSAPAVNVPIDQVVTVGYMGSSSHTPDLEMIAPVLNALLQKYGEKLRLQIWGTPLPDSLVGKPGVEWTASPSNNYRDFASYFQAQSADIFIAPLSDNLFNRCKSGLKFLEYSALGVPGVFSNLEGYSALITNGRDGFLAGSLQDWEQALTRLLEEPGLRAEIAHNAQVNLKTKWLLSKNISTWQDVLKSGELSFGNKRQVKMASADLINAISDQVFWLQRAKDELAQHLQESNLALAAKVDSSIADLDKERQAYLKLKASFQAKTQEVETLSIKAESKAAEVKSIADRLEEVTVDNKRLGDKAEQLNKAIDVLNQQREDDAIEKQRLVGVLEEKTSEVSTLENRISQQNQAMDLLTRQQADGASEKKRLAGLIDEKVQQNQQLSAELADRVGELEAIKVSKAWKVAVFLRKVRGKIAPVDGKLTKFIKKVYPLILTQIRKKRNWINNRQNLRIIKNSQLFDKYWYLIKNPDLQKAKADPVIHYMLFGAFEGRDPGPNFSSSQYLAENDDVRVSGMNPLVHYLKFGRNEGRTIAQAKIVEPEMTSYDGILSGRELFKKIAITKEHNTFILSMSHDNYLRNVGGVQIKLSDEQEIAMKEKVSYLHLYPYINRPNLAQKNEQFFVGVNLDGVEIGITDRTGIKVALRKLGHSRLRAIHIHHTMGFDLNLIKEIIKKEQNKIAQFWLHDFFSICPGYFLLRNDIEFCGVPNWESNECAICKYGKQRQLQHPEFNKLFNEIKMEVIAPSNFALGLWKSSFPLNTYKTKVVPHLQLNWKEPIPSIHASPKIIVAFVGFPVNHKGWGAWTQLLEQIGSDPRYKFIHFSSVNGNLAACERVPIKVSPENRNAMVDALRDNDVDVAFLWSICPETFSYTLYESLAAGCFVVTNKDSGNIQNFIVENPHRGVVLENKESLLRLFVSEELAKLVNEYQKNGIPKAELVFPD